MTYVELVREVRKLSPQERRALLDVLEREVQNDTAAPNPRTLLDYYGVAAHLADGTDPQEYVNRLRDEWDDHP
jgi:hypothetical protein